MSGSRLGRGRGARLAIYAGCGVLAFFLVFLYRAANSEMTRLRELHLKCAQQQEALAAQLQVIFEYKARLEKSLAEEKSSNAAVKQELQQRASREKSLRDKDSVEAMQRFNSLQQTYKLLQTEHQDLQEECKKREKQALDQTSGLESTLQDLRGRIRQAQEEKTKSMENFKTKYMNLQMNMNRLQEKYNEQMNVKGETENTIMHLQKEVSQLKRELEKAKNFYVRSTSPGPSLVSPSALQKEGSQPIPAPQQQQPQQSAAHDVVSSRRADNSSTVASANNGNLMSPSLDKAPSPHRPKVKLPIGVLPIPEIREDDKKSEEKRPEEIRKREDAAHNSPPKFVPPANHPDSKEKEAVVEAGNLDPPFVANLPARHIGDQIERRVNDGWFKVGPGVQEVGEEPNRVPGLDDGQANGGDDQYDGVEYDKEPQKNDIRLAEGEDEGEDEGDMFEYPHNLNQGKRE
ncbi:PREDICTED: Golgi integral membrane protein 4-like isoform X2 [Dinoponera quadriceps]|uniref:Golgi integral membrane protein 4-like isoform X2 n=1 Tax=Dinoponera quadriceps TaxID=609295 RepID=A0A6P3X8M4_DINQU|nr:PREDICTED: Golgi integral membrane protein 4-like isoform X2 [Dinoponera quadriceps]